MAELVVSRSSGELVVGLGDRAGSDCVLGDRAGSDCVLGDRAGSGCVLVRAVGVRLVGTSVPVRRLPGSALPPGGPAPTFARETCDASGAAELVARFAAAGFADPPSRGVADVAAEPLDHVVGLVGAAFGDFPESDVGRMVIPTSVATQPSATATMRTTRAAGRRLRSVGGSGGLECLPMCLRREMMGRPPGARGSAC